MKKINNYIFEKLTEKAKKHKQEVIAFVEQKKDEFFKDKNNFLKNKFTKFSFGWSLDSLFNALKSNIYDTHLDVKSAEDLLIKLSKKSIGQNKIFPDFWGQNSYYTGSVVDKVPDKLIKKSLDICFTSINKKSDNPMILYVAPMTSYNYICNIKGLSHDEQFTDDGFLEINNFTLNDKNVIYEDILNNVRLRGYIWNDWFSIVRIDFPKENINEKLSLNKNLNIPSYKDNPFIICFCHKFAELNKKE